MSEDTVPVLVENRVLEESVAAATSATAATAATAPYVPPKEAEVEGFTVHLLEDCAILTLAGGMSKTISLPDYVNLVVAAYGHTMNEMGTRLRLPRNTLSVSTLSAGIGICLYYPETYQQVKTPSRSYTVKMPNILIPITLRADGDFYVVTRFVYLCTDLAFGDCEASHTATQDHPKRIFLLPTGNIYDDGRLCVGNNSMPNKFPKGDLRGLNWYHDVLFNSPFNNDLQVRALRSSHDSRSSVDSWYSYLEAVTKDNKPFPYDSLAGFSPRS